MTLHEAVKSNPILVNVPDPTVEAAFTMRGYDRTLDFTTALAELVELVSADLYMALAASPEIREGDVSLKWNPGTLVARATQIYSKYDDPALEGAGYRKVNPTITKL